MEDFSGGTHGFVVGHITPEAFEGGLIGLVEDNDIIEIDAVKNTITLKVADEMIAERRKKWKKPALKATKGVLFKYAQVVKDASQGCVTDEDIIGKCEEYWKCGMKCKMGIDQSINCQSKNRVLIKSKKWKRSK